MTFLQLPALEFEGRDKWKLATEMVYHSKLFDLTITIPKGFITDLASIPRLFTRLIPVNGRHRAPAVVHDYLYSTKGHINYVPRNGGFGITIPRKECDLIFLEAMKEAGVSAWKRNVMYAAVRAGGWASF